MTAHRFFLAILLTFELISLAEAQRQHPPEPLQRNQNIYVSTFSGVSTEPRKSRLMAFYRLPKSFFVFTRDEGSGDPNSYVAHCEVSCEVRDRAQTPIAQKLTKRTLHSDTNFENSADASFVTGGFTFDLPPGLYAAKIEINDAESKRSYREDSLNITLKNYSADSLTISDLLFISPSPDSSAKHITPINYGTTLPFGSPSRCYFQFVPQTSLKNIRVSYEMYLQASEGSQRAIVFRDTLPPGLLEPAPEYTLQEGTESLSPGKAFLPKAFSGIFGMNLDSLQQGNYVIELHIDDGMTQHSVQQRVSIKWIGMPLSLRSLPTAIAAMKYILSEKEFDDLNSARAENQKKMFEAYWKKRDATPATAFNEVMGEFYRRVDHATTAFTTLREENGMKTDRGKVYILYGPPTRVERKLLPSSPPQEIWYYERLKKKIVFLDPARAGDYKLQSMDNL